MAARETPVCEFGTIAPDFDLPSVDGRRYRIADCRGKAGTVVIFICNHCPYVKAAIGRIANTARRLEPHGVKFIAINSNDASKYPEDSFAGMEAFAAQHDLPFPYLHDETQQVARAYGAICTPDFFGYNLRLELQYRGRLDDGRTGAPSPGAPDELFEAMVMIAETGKGPSEQKPSMGCSIKWKPDEQ